MKELIKRIMPDPLYLRIVFRKRMGQKLDLKHPKTFNQKLQWLKLHDHNPLYVKLVDKYEVKNIVRDQIGEKYIIPTIGVWNTFDDIDFKGLPNQFVLKCTHDSGSVVICKDKATFDIEKARIKLKNGQKNNFYYMGREWPYKKITPRIIAEKYIVDSETGRLDDYKFFCFNGKVDNVMVVRGRDTGSPKFYHFDCNWNLCRFNRLTRSLPDNYRERKPPFIDDMIHIAEILSKDMLHVRIDLYEADGQIYFGEYTLYNQSGWETGFDEYSDGYLGSLIKLPIDN